MKVIDSLTVKGVEVDVYEKVLRFTKNGDEVEIDRQVGHSDYSLVYRELKRKGTKRTDGYKTVGNFVYWIDLENTLTIYRKDDVSVELHEHQLTTDESKYPRNYVINWLINNL